MKLATRLHSFLTLPAFLLLLLAMTAPALFARPKTDVLVMKNGDRITCEIKSLENGQLNIKTDYTSGTIPVNWTKVERIESKQFFRVEMKNGLLHTGIIELLPDSEEGEDDFRITADDERREVSQRDVVDIDQLERTWKSNLSGAFDLGLGFTKNNNTTDLTLNASVDYKTNKREVKNRYSTTIRRQKAPASNTNRNNFSNSLINHMKGQWFNGTLFDLLQSDEQQLDLRATMGGGIGRYFIHTNRTSLSVLGGGVFTREIYSETAVVETERQNNFEGLIAVDFKIYRFDSSQITAKVSIFPSVTTPGRIRMDSDVSLKLDLWGDLYWNFSFWQNTDSKPPVRVPTTDYGIGTTVGWSF